MNNFENERSDPRSTCLVQLDRALYAGFPSRREHSPPTTLPCYYTVSHTTSLDLWVRHMVSNLEESIFSRGKYCKTNYLNTL